jgi:hypothetical protein
MTMPAGWKKNTSTKMTLAEFLKNQKEPPSFEGILATFAVTFYSTGEKFERDGPTPYWPTGYNPVTGKYENLEPRLTELEKLTTMRRIVASEAGDEYKEVIAFANKMAIRGDFALAYILLWKLYRIAPYISDLPQCMEQCLTKLRPVGPKDILQAATSCVQHLPQSEYQTMFYQILSEYSKTEYIR